MNSLNPRLERLKELVSLEERRVSMQEELETITRKMSSLRDSLFDEGASVLTKLSPARSSAPAPAAKAAAAPAASKAKASGGRSAARPAKRAQRGELKEQVIGALNAAGTAGVRVTELAKALGMKPVNIHSWFHSSIKRYPQIKKLKGGHYRLEGKLNGTAPAKSEAAAPSKPAVAKSSPARKSSGAGRKAGGANSRRGALSEKVLGELRKAGAKGISVRDLANRIGANYRNIYIWFATTGKKNAAVKKIAPAQYRLVS